MLEHGKNLYESKLPILDHFRDMMSLIVYERRLFASLPHNKVSSNDQEEKLEQYEREHHEENEQLTISVSQFSKNQMPLK